MSTMIKNISRLLVHVMLLGTVLMVVGCASQPDSKNLQPPKHPAQQVLKDDVTYAIDVYDPLEGLNRNVYMFNYYFDEYFFLPIVHAYEFITPDYVEERISYFVDNVLEFGNFTNNLLQLKFKRSGIVLERFVINSTVGVAGFWDRASEFGIHKQPEDFGQTLGFYGVGDGPYLVLPVLGPSNLRNASGFIADSVLFNAVGPARWVDDEASSLIFTGVSAVDKRHRIPFRYYRSGSPFEYELVRQLYTKKQEMEIAK